MPAQDGKRILRSRCLTSSDDQTDLTGRLAHEITRSPSSKRYVTAPPTRPSPKPRSSARGSS